MLQKIKQFIFPKINFSLVTNTALVFDPNKDNFEILLKKINIYFSRHQEQAFEFKNELYYLNNNLNSISHAERLIYAVMPYSFVLKFDHKKIEVLRDEEAKMFYVYMDGKKLYYHKGFTNIEDVQKSFTYISAEQDAESPHRYLDNTFFVTSQDVVADFGAAEGNFSLSAVDKVKELYIIESDIIWMDALHKTFEPWKTKVHIINKYAGNHVNENTTTLAHLFEGKILNVLKMDIEGAELSVLKNSESFISERNIKMAITTYHRNDDAFNIKAMLEKNGYKTVFSDKFILFVYDNLTPPFFRKGLIKAMK